MPRSAFSQGFFPAIGGQAIIDYDTVRAAYAALNAGDLDPGDAVRVAWDADAFVSAGETVSIVGPEGTFVRGLLDVEGGVPLPKVGVTITARPVGASTTPIVVNGAGYPEVDNTSFSGTATAHISDLEFDTIELIESTIQADLPTAVVNSGASVMGQDIVSSGVLRVNFVNQSLAGTFNVGFNVAGGFGTSTLTSGGGSDYFDGRTFSWAFEVLERVIANPRVRGGVDSLSPDDAPVYWADRWLSGSEGDYEAGPTTTTGIYINDSSTAGAGTIVWTHLRARASAITFT